eukprot:TRINITY_DN113962_c0_g1_i1.p1 TRINITY_DN113962_c0_g1~~TRINITY_DN113962_c0_g1_i1.p1  ORF type:complete len:157 (+),score=17.12 TRINITY_DN113962_c0_g1_i1:81-551(+)
MGCLSTKEPTVDPQPAERRSMRDLIPKDTPCEGNELEAVMGPASDRWLFETSGKFTHDGWGEAFELQVRLPDQTIHSVTRTSHDTVGDTKAAVGDAALMPRAELDGYALYYPGPGRMEEKMTLGQYACRWNGTRMELQVIEEMIADAKEYWEGNRT